MIVTREVAFPSECILLHQVYYNIWTLSFYKKDEQTIWKKEKKNSLLLPAVIKSCVMHETGKAKTR